MSKKKPCELKGTAGAIAAIPYREPQQADNHCLEGSWDLHTHSTFSDGEYTVDELIAGTCVRIGTSCHHRTR